jgi:hypothetical protein
MLLARPLAWFGGRRGAVLMLAFGTVAFFAQIQAADATILPAVTIDGPSSEIAGFGGVAMAEDGTGGVAYLKRVNGVNHVFVSRYVGGHWQAPIRVDTEEPYAASWVRIGASDGGELVVVWATPFATEDEAPVYELLSATLGPGGSSFGPAMIVDPDIERATGTSPDLAMSSTGQADVVYRVVQEVEGSNSSVTLLRPSDVVEQVRVAHFNGERWTNMGEINRDPGLSMRPPTELNAPKIAINALGNGVVTWQEPEITTVARIWARRIFGATLDYTMAVSAPTFNGLPIGEDAEAPSVAVSRLGEAVVAYRQEAGAGSPLPGPRIFIDTLPNGESKSGAEFEGAIVADSSVPGGKSARIGPPSVDLDEKEEVRLTYDDDGTPRVVEGDDRGLSGTLSLGPGYASSIAEQSSDELASASVMNPEGGGISAWPSADVHGHTAVAVREDYPEGGVQTALVGTASGGPVSELAVGRSGLGDGLVAFQQGPIGNAAIAVAQVTSPPSQFVISVPKGWLKPSQATVSWEPAPSANGPLNYAVVLDGHELPVPAGSYSLSLSPRLLGSGIHEVQVLAIDRFGQATLTAPSKLRIAAQPPTVTVARTMGGLGVTVKVSDRFSGVDTSALRISFGDGTYANGRTRVSHRYTHPGIYTITVSVRDKSGNAGVVRKLVSAR